jgi:hypothetical protein
MKSYKVGNYNEMIQHLAGYRAKNLVFWGVTMNLYGTKSNSRDDVYTHAPHFIEISWVDSEIMD